MSEYDLLVIGGGPGGLAAAAEAAALGATVAVADAGRLGGTCLNWGCIPTKSLIQAGKVAHTIRTADQFGIEVGTPRPEWGPIMQRIRQVVSDLQHVVETFERAGAAKATRKITDAFDRSFAPPAPAAAAH